MKDKLLLITLILFMMLGVSGCMQNNVVIEEENRESQAQMLEFAEKKFNSKFEVVEFIPAKRGFNDSLNENVLVLKKDGTSMLVNIRETLAKPKNYYDDYVNALASYMSKNLVNYSVVPNLKYAKTYVSLKQDKVSYEENLTENILNPDNVIDITSVINVNAKPSEENMKGLYSVYEQLQKQKFNDFFMVVGFTDDDSAFEKYVNNYMLYGYKKWADIGKNVYATLTVSDRNLTYEEFKSKIQ